MFIITIILLLVCASVFCCGNSVHSFEGETRMGVNGLLWMIATDIDENVTIALNGIVLGSDRVLCGRPNEHELLNAVSYAGSGMNAARICAFGAISQNTNQTLQLRGDDDRILFQVLIDAATIPRERSIDAAADMCHAESFDALMLRKILPKLKLVPDEMNMLHYRFAGSGLQSNSMLKLKCGSVYFDVNEEFEFKLFPGFEQVCCAIAVENNVVFAYSHEFIQVPMCWNEIFLSEMNNTEFFLTCDNQSTTTPLNIAIKVCARGIEDTVLVHNGRHLISLETAKITSEFDCDGNSVDAADISINFDLGVHEMRLWCLSSPDVTDSLIFWVRNCPKSGIDEKCRVLNDSVTYDQARAMMQTPSMIKGDNMMDHYEMIYRLARKIKNVEGFTIEIGVRQGGGSLAVLTGLLSNCDYKYHIMVDPYGSIEYDHFQSQNQTTYKYNNELKDLLLSKLHDFSLKNNMNIQMLTLDDAEYFKRYQDGIPIYKKEKQVINKYSLVILDGPHSLRAVLDETLFFAPRVSIGGFIIFDNVVEAAHDSTKPFDANQIFDVVNAKMQLPVVSAVKAVRFSNYDQALIDIIMQSTGFVQVDMNAFGSRVFQKINATV